MQVMGSTKRLQLDNIQLRKKILLHEVSEHDRAYLNDLIKLMDENWV